MFGSLLCVNFHLFLDTMQNTRKIYAFEYFGRVGARQMNEARVGASLEPDAAGHRRKQAASYCDGDASYRDRAASHRFDPELTDSALKLLIRPSSY